MPKSSFYNHPAVRQRLIEFIGGDSLEAATAAYLTHSDGQPFDRKELHPARELDWFLERNLDISRSLADSTSQLLHLDIEYVNFDSPAEAFLAPARAFELQEPVVRVIESQLLQWGIRPLHLVTGQGHHFVWRIGRTGELAGRIAALCPAPEVLPECARRVPPEFTTVIDLEAQRAFGALSLIMEYVVHRVKAEAARVSALPVEITAVHVGSGTTAQREIISLDTSEYGDPLHTRMVRMPFTNYLKPWLNGLARSLQIEHAIPRLHAIPLHEMDIYQALKVRQTEAAVLELASRAGVGIPEQAAGTARLLDAYLASPLRQFHEYFYADQHDDRGRWSQTYDHTPLTHFPPCMRHIVQWPNDLLLKPAGLQLVTRCLLANGWHPRHIAGFIRSKFENPIHRWRLNWEDYEPATRADFYVRLFAGLCATGLDQLTDLNCVATREKGFCRPLPNGGCTLEPIRLKLLAHLSS
jgi:hypothetical protein